MNHLDQVVIDRLRNLQRIHGRLPRAFIMMAVRHKLILLHTRAIGSCDRVAEAVVGVHQILESLPAYLPVRVVDKAGIVSLRQLLFCPVRHFHRRQLHVRFVRLVKIASGASATSPIMAISCSCSLLRVCVLFRITLRRKAS